MSTTSATIKTLNIRLLKDVTRQVIGDYDENDNPIDLREATFPKDSLLNVEFLESDLNSSVVMLDTDEVLELTSDEFESFYEGQDFVGSTTSAEQEVASADPFEEPSETPVVEANQENPVVAPVGEVQESNS